jgi:HPt (histidine-containing phosphotransfer) domain-containing protein
MLEPIYSKLGADADLSELVEMFVQEIPDRVAALQAQFAARDMAELARTAHQIKGAAGSYGFGAVTPSAARLESSAKAQEPEEAVQEALDELIGTCMRLRAGTPE